MQDHPLSGILNINKATGMTSHDVVARIRKLVNQRRVGHAGTLDPLAIGVLLICLGQATRVSEYLMASDKVYRARLWLGITTDTYDSEGQITRSVDASSITQAQVAGELSQLVGIVEQVPPMYSAIKHEGRPLYRLARRGQTVARKPREVEIMELRLLEWAPPQFEMRIHCSKGTYVRSLAHDLGQRLGCGAHLVGLVRTASGRFRIEDSTTLEQLAEVHGRGQLQSLLQPLDAALQRFAPVTVDGPTTRRISFGQRVQLADSPKMAMCRAYAEDGRLLALLRREDGDLWRPHKVFVQPENHDHHTKSGRSQHPT
jgi:tRNA pseudouridine55 synthase